MNKIIIFGSVIISIVLVNFGITAKAQVDELKNENIQLQANNEEIKEKIKNMESYPKQHPIYISTEYGVFMNKIRLLESYSGANMNVELDSTTDSQDISKLYEDTEYKGVRGLKVKIVVDKVSKELDMGAVLDAIYRLERSTDFLASEISKDNNNLIVKGEIYGL